MARRRYANVRVSQATKDRMDLEIERLVRAADAGRREHDRPDANNNPAYRGMSHDDLIVRLLDLDAATRRRRAKSAARRRRPPQDHDPVVSNHGGDE